MRILAKMLDVLGIDEIVLFDNRVIIVSHKLSEFPYIFRANDRIRPAIHA